MHRNKLSPHKTLFEKNAAYRRDIKADALAYDASLYTYSLKSIPAQRVEFIGGLWRIQNQFKETITTVRDRDFVLGARLDITEKNLFEFYRAALVSENCYGSYIGDSNYIVAKYTTDKKTYWAYGTSIEQARAFMGIKLYDEYMGLIHATVCQDSQEKQK